MKKSLKAKSSSLRLTKKSSTSVCREIQKSVDNALLILPPKVQANIDQALKSLERSAFQLQDLKSIGYRVLQHAVEISDAMKNTTIRTKAKRKLRAKA